MGARASVILTREGETSPVLCQHWGGSEFHEDVREWAKEQFALSQDENKRRITDRWGEPERIFVRLIQKFGEDGYVGKTRDEVDDSDHGCLSIELGNDGPIFTLL